MCAKRSLKSTCTSAQSDQSLLSAWRNCILGYPKWAQWRFWSDCTFVQSDQILCWAQMSEDMLSSMLSSVAQVVFWSYIMYWYHIYPKYSGTSAPHHTIKCPKISFPKVSDKMAYANSIGPDQTAPERAIWSGSTLFAIPQGILGNNCITSGPRWPCITHLITRQVLSHLDFWLKRRSSI